MFNSFFIGGFESSTHRTNRGRRIDMIAATRHDALIMQDYARLRFQGISTAREALRWHLIERVPGEYDFSSVLPTIRAAKAMGVQVLWDLCHYGWPDGLDIYGPAFIEHFVGLARAFSRLLADETDSVPLIAPVNEISFFSWAGGDVGYFNPFSVGRGRELKLHLAHAAIEACDAFWSVIPEARILHIDPLINIISDSDVLEDRFAAEQRRLSQYEAWDMVSGRQEPQLGGDPRYLDIIGVNYYHNNQWFLSDGKKVERSDPIYKPFSRMLMEVYHRYDRPLFISETGIEDDDRPEWLRYVCEEVRTAITEGVPVGGICLYPILNHPGWDNERHCHNGLWDYSDDLDSREIYKPLGDELQRQIRLFEEFFEKRRSTQADVPGSRTKDDEELDYYAGISPTSSAWL